MVTASALVEERAAILAAGVDELVRKPFGPEDVFECMACLLGVRYTYDERRAAVLPERLRQELAEALMALEAFREHVGEEAI